MRRSRAGTPITTTDMRFVYEAFSESVTVTLKLARQAPEFGVPLMVPAEFIDRPDGMEFALNV